jgi:hypothetical protein
MQAAVGLLALVWVAADVGAELGANVDVVAVGADPRLHFVGAAERTQEPGAMLRFSSAGVRLRARGTLRLVWAEQPVVVDGDVPPDPGGRFDAIIEAVDDGAMRRMVAVEEGVPLLVPSLSTVTVIKATEALFGARRLLAIEVGPIDGQAPLVDVAPAPPPTLLVLGDSWATGFGVRGDLPDPVTGVAPGPTCPFTIETQDVREAWPWIVGEGLGVDVAVVGWSGRGLLRDYEGDEATTTVPELWARSAVTPDSVAGVVVALGHNDGVTGVPDEDRFRAAWLGTLASLRERLGDDVTVVVLLPDFQDEAPAIDRSAIFRRLFAVDGVSLIPEPTMNIGLGQGCVWHPGTRAHADFARRLLPLLAGPLHAGTSPR